MPAWIWLILGIAMMVLELLVPSGFFLFILGIAGLCVGIIVAAGFASSWILEVCIFCVIAVVSWILLGKRLPAFFAAKVQPQGQLVGSVVVVSEDITVGGHGAGELWGTQWRLENVDHVPLLAGSEVLVVDSQGIRLKVKKK